MTTITIINPFSGATVERDISGVTQAQVDAYAHILDDETLHELEGNDTPTEWLVAFVDHVGAEEAGRVILGS